MKAWASAAGKLARYEHIGWRVWPHSRCCAFHSGSRARLGSALGSSRASWPGSWRMVWSGIPGFIGPRERWAVPREGPGA